jgi:hypothetical protein
MVVVRGHGFQIFFSFQICTKKKTNSGMDSPGIVCATSRECRETRTVYFILYDTYSNYSLYSLADCHSNIRSFSKKYCENVNVLV